MPEQASSPVPSFEREDIARLFHFLRHLRPGQAMARAYLAGKRRSLVALNRLAPWALAGSRAQLPSLCPTLPLPILPPRTAAVRRDDEGLVLDLLGEPYSLTVPVRWKPATLSHLRVFHLHYMEYLEAVGDADFEALVLDWGRANPPLQARYWESGWSSYVLSIRVVVWMQQYAIRQERLPAPLGAILIESIVRQVRFLRRNLETDIGGNHLLKNVKALLWAGRFFAGPEAAGWLRTGERLLAREVQRQILPDGVHFERSPAYHSQVFADLLECRALVHDGSAVAILDAALERMAQALADLTHPDGRVSLMNDGGLSMAHLPEVLLSAYSRYSPSSPSARPAFALNSSGYFGVRDSGDFFLVDCGPIGPDDLPAHGHGDILSFEWTLSALRVLVDAGVYEYAAGPWRAYARSTKAHNTVTVDDADQCEFFGSFRVGRRARAKIHECTLEGDLLCLHGSHDGYARLPGGPIHHRRVKASPRRVEIEDTVEGGRGQAVRAHLLFHPDCGLERRPDEILITRGKRKIRLKTSGVVSLGPGWWCPNFGTRQEAQRVTIHYGQAPCDGALLLEPVDANLPR